jgi:ABC-2 type transport system permease protein
MTTTAQRPLSPDASTSSRGSSLTGTGTLIRFILRRDRIKLPAWLLGITLFVYYYGAALPQIYPTDEDLRAISQFMAGPVGALIAGPGYGVDEPTIARIVVGIYGLYIIIPAALMSILLVSRHTRVEEQTGRAELVRASVVGRHASLTATLVVAAAANVVLALLIYGTMAAHGFDSGDGLLFGASVGAAGLVFAGITAITVQVTEYSRAASGLAGAALGVAYVIRAAGDMLEEGGSLLSWFSPIAWSQQTRAYVDGRWWPLLLSIALVAVTVTVGFVLSIRRDVGLGLVPARRGAPEAAPWLSSPLAFAFRLHRASLIGWALALAAAGALYGSITQPIVDTFQDLSSEVIEIMGGDATNMLDGYLSVMVLFDTLLVVVFVILGVQTMRAEETRGRAEPILATATSRRSWLASHVAVLTLGAVGLLAAVGLALGGATAISISDGAYVWPIVAAHLAYTPAVLVFLGAAGLLFGLLPRAVGATWALLGFALIVGFFGPIMDLPGWVFDLSPFEHVARLPLEELAWTPLLVLTAVAAILTALGDAGFRRRDLDTT